MPPKYVRAFNAPTVAAVATVAALFGCVPCPGRPISSTRVRLRPDVARFDQAFEYVGYVEHRGPRPRLRWTASGFRFRFNGESFSLSLLDHPGPPTKKNHHEASWHNLVQVQIDAQAPETMCVNATPSTYRFERLGPGLHTVSVRKRTEALVGDIEVLDVSVPHGDLLAARSKVPARHLLAVGDSITAAYGNECTNKLHPFTPFTENGLASYAALAARSFAAAYTAIAWSGKGVVRNFGGSTTESMSDIVLPILTKGTLTDGPPPDAVIVNLGSNDFSGGGSVLPQGFAEGYKRLLIALRKAFPATLILCGIGPTLSNEWPDGIRALESAQAQIGTVIDQLRQAGDKRIERIDFARQNESDGHGCDWHPSQKTHRRMARTLGKRLSERLGWSIEVPW